MDVIVYHSNCPDGITALWAAKKRWPDAEALAGVYQQAPDLAKFAGRDVLVVDFSWSRETTLAVAEVAKHVTVLDHHATAAKNLEGASHERLTCIFDMARSGAGMAWDFCFPEERRPALVDYVEDRDLWRFELPLSREVHAACSAFPLTLESREHLMQCTIAQLQHEGAAILRYHDKLVAEAAKNARPTAVLEYTVPGIACPAAMIVSDLCGLLAKDQPFAVAWTDCPDGMRRFSLRSAPDGINVAEVAERFGGGGHKHAAGFALPTPGWPPIVKP